MEVMSYVKPELLVLVPVLYILGVALKQSKHVRDELIPLTLGCCGVALTALWLAGTSVPANAQELAMLLFTSIVQGLLVAGMAVYSNQLLKQAKK